MDIPSRWTRGLENPEEIERGLKAQVELFKRLYDIVEEMENVVYKDKLKKANYEKKNWSEFQADSIGYSRCLSDMKDLLKFTKE